jgi:hypothetical protein
MKEALGSSETSVLTRATQMFVTSQKTPFFIVTAVKTSDLTLQQGAVIPTERSADIEQ